MHQSAVPAYPDAAPAMVPPSTTTAYTDAKQPVVHCLHEKMHPRTAQASQDAQPPGMYHLHAVHALVRPSASPASPDTKLSKVQHKPAMMHPSAATAHLDALLTEMLPQHARMQPRAPTPTRADTPAHTSPLMLDKPAMMQQNAARAYLVPQSDDMPAGSRTVTAPSQHARTQGMPSPVPVPQHNTQTPAIIGAVARSETVPTKLLSLQKLTPIISIEVQTPPPNKQY